MNCIIEANSDLLTVKEVANLLRMPVPTVYYHAQRGQLPAIRLGGRWRFKRSALDAELAKAGGTAGAVKACQNEEQAKAEKFEAMSPPPGFIVNQGHRLVIGMPISKETLAELATLTA